jgi:uncharacterized protein YndB with AHSA1/START domain
MNAILLQEDRRRVLRFERRLRHPPERVWRAVTEPDELARWFPSAVRYEPRVGAPMTFDFGGKHGIASMPGEVLAWDPPRAFAFAWGEDVLRFELEPTDAGTLLVFTHSFEHQPGKPARDAAGWSACFERFDAMLDGREAASGDWSGHHERYLAQFGELRVDDCVVRLQGPVRELDGRPAIDVRFDERPGVMVVSQPGRPLEGGATVELRAGSIDAPGEPITAGVLVDPLAS